MTSVRLTRTLLAAVWRRIDALTPRRGRCCVAAAVLSVALAHAPESPAGTREVRLSAADAATLRDVLADVAARRDGTAARLAKAAARRLPRES